MWAIVTKLGGSPPWDPGPRAERGGREEKGEKEQARGKGGRDRVPFSGKSWGYSALQYILYGLTPKPNRCASRFATTASALRASAAPGWSGGNAPKTVFPTLGARPTHARRGGWSVHSERNAGAADRLCGCPDVGINARLRGDDARRRWRAVDAASSCLSHAPLHTVGTTGEDAATAREYHAKR